MAYYLTKILKTAAIAGSFLINAAPSEAQSISRVGDISTNMFRRSDFGFRVDGKGILLHLDTTKIGNPVGSNPYAFCPDDSVTGMSPIEIKKIPVCYQMWTKGSSMVSGGGQTRVGSSFSFSAGKNMKIDGDPYGDMTMTCPDNQQSLKPLTPDELSIINAGLFNKQIRVAALPDVFDRPAAYQLPDGRTIILSLDDTNRDRNYDYKAKAFMVEQDGTTTEIPMKFHPADNSKLPYELHGYEYEDHGQTYAYGWKGFEQGPATMLHKTDKSWDVMEGSVSRLPQERIGEILDRYKLEKEFIMPALVNPCEEFKPSIF